MTALGPAAAISLISLSLLRHQHLLTHLASAVVTRGPTMNSKYLILDDKAVLGLLKDNTVVEQFTSVKAALESAKNKADSHAVKQGCKPCQVRSKQVIIDIMAVKKAIARLGDDDKVKIKELLKTEKVIVVFKGDNNVVSKIEF